MNTQSKSVALDYFSAVLEAAPAPRQAPEPRQAPPRSNSGGFEDMDDECRERIMTASDCIDAIRNLAKDKT